jgi:hypothetical protein
MKSDYEERKSRIMLRLAERAAKQRTESDRLFKRSDEMASVIPMGQPILVGHHSEKGHRNYLKKIHNTMDKAVQANQKAQYFESRLESMENNSSISSDDPEALTKLKDKLEGLSNLQIFMKSCNKIINNKKLTDVQKVEQLTKFHNSITEAKAYKLLAPDFCGRVGFASYKLTNNNANMSRIKDRIKSLESVASMSSEEITINNVKIRTSVEDNRVQVFFPDIPVQAIRHELKSNGFHWSPSVGAWQRQISNYAIHRAKQIVKTMCKPDGEDKSTCENCAS